MPFLSSVVRQRPVTASGVASTGTNQAISRSPVQHLQEALKKNGAKIAVGTAISLIAFTSTPSISLAEQSMSPSSSTTQNATQEITPVYFGNGCFWGRQKDFFDTELKMGRNREETSAVVGYAGGRGEGPNKQVCYYYSLPNTIYEKLGHAEVVQVGLKGDDTEQQFKMFADTYFSQFQKTPLGMMRLDPQDRGNGYRNVIGIPGGMNSPLYKILETANVNGMQLKQGSGNDQDRANERDELNVVYVVDSAELPFYLAEQYHQYHNGLGKAFPKEYTRDMKNIAMKTGKIGPTGCPEYPF